MSEERDRCSEWPLESEQLKGNCRKLSSLEFCHCSHFLRPSELLANLFITRLGDKTAIPKHAPPEQHLLKWRAMGIPLPLAFVSQQNRPWASAIKKHHSQSLSTSYSWNPIKAMLCSDAFKPSDFFFSVFQTFLNSCCKDSNGCFPALLLNDPLFQVPSVG